MANEVPGLIRIKRVLLGPHHLNPGRTKHSIADGNSVRPFPPFQSLEIAHDPDTKGYFLFHICADGQVADTWHDSLKGAIQQAEWELEVKPDEWIDISSES
jgi:hypothetical protein